MDEILLEMVCKAVCREGFYEQCTHRIHGDYVYFIVEDCGVKLGAYKVSQDWFKGKDLTSAGFAVISMLQDSLIPMKQVDTIFAAPLPFDVLDDQTEGSGK